MVIRGVLRGGNGQTEPPPWGYRASLQILVALCGVGASDAWTEYCQLPDGNGRALLTCYQLLSWAAQQPHPGACCGRHWSATPGCRDPRFWGI